MKKSVLAKNLGVPVEAFKNIPAGELFIFTGTAAPADINAQNVTASAGIIPRATTYSYHWSQQQPAQFSGGSVKVLDPTTFPIAAKFSGEQRLTLTITLRKQNTDTSKRRW